MHRCVIVPSTLYFNPHTTPGNSLNGEARLNEVWVLPQSSSGKLCNQRAGFCLRIHLECLPCWVWPATLCCFGIADADGCSWNVFSLLREKTASPPLALQVPSRQLLKSQWLIMPCNKTKTKTKKPRCCCVAQAGLDSGSQMMRFAVCTTIPGVSASFSHSLLNYTIWYVCCCWGPTLWPR